MSRLYDAKQAALKAYPDDKESGIDLFIEFVGCDLSDIEYEIGMPVEQYIYDIPMSAQMRDKG